MDRNQPDYVAAEVVPPTAETPGATPEGARKPYATPRLSIYGAIRDVTRVDLIESGPAPSDRALKEGFDPIDPRAILASVVGLPIETWSYKGETVRHLGPMAQDFAAAFGVGGDVRRIHLLDASGVALAAIQGLHALAADQAGRLAGLESELAALRAELRVLRAECRAGAFEPVGRS